MLNFSFLFVFSISVQKKGKKFLFVHEARASQNQFLFVRLKNCFS